MVGCRRSGCFAGHGGLFRGEAGGSNTVGRRTLRGRPHGAADPGAELPADHGARRPQGDAAAALRGEGTRGRAQRARRPHRRHGLRHPKRLRRAGAHADRRPPRAGGPALQRVPQHGRVLADADGPAQRPQPPHEQHGRDHRDGHRVSGQHGAAPEQRGAPCRNAAAQRLQHGRVRQEPRDGRRGRPASPGRPTAGRRAPASTSSTASSAARRTSGRPPSTTA